MDKLIIHATKRSMYKLVQSKLEEAATEIELRPCKHCKFTSVARGGLSTGHRFYFLYWDSYSAYLSLWLGQGQLRISSPSTGMKEIVIHIPMEEMAERGMTRTA